MAPIRCALGICAGICFLLGSGCELLNKQLGYGEAKVFSDALGPAVTFSALASNGEISYSASVEVTSQSMQNLLHRLGLSVMVAPEPNGGVRLWSTTPDGGKFALIIQSVPSATQVAAGAQTTKVHIEWDKTSDSKRGFQVLADLETQSVKKGIKG